MLHLASGNLVKDGDKVIDFHLAYLKKLFDILDRDLVPINEEIRIARHQSRESAFHAGEDLIGFGFVAAQRYITEIYTSFKREKGDALTVGPQMQNNISVATVCNAAANCWKHQSEWWECDIAGKKLGKPAEKTIEIISNFTDLEYYPCAVLLHKITGKDLPVMSDLIPMLISWRNQVAGFTDQHSGGVLF